MSPRGRIQFSRFARSQRGSVSAAAMFMLLTLWLALAALQMSVVSQYDAVNRMKLSAMAVNLAEAGAAKALWEARRGNASYAGEEAALATGAFGVSVRREGGQLVVISTGYVPNRKAARALERVRVLASPGGAVLAWQKL